MPSTPVPDAQLSAKARSVRAILREEGASFFNEIASTMAAPDVAEGLAELVRLGEATNDSFEVMRHVLRTGTAVIPRDAPARRLRASALSGRWSLTHRAGIVGAPLDEDARARRLAADLLRRFGLVAHEVAQVDGTPMPWSELRRVYARMEARGELRRGYFVRGLSGEQYATTEVVERLRDARVPGDPADAIVVNVLDPANPWGASLPMPPVPRFSRSPRNYLVLLRGEPILLAGREGRDLIPMRALTGSEIQAAARALHRLLDVPPAVRRRRSVVVESWAGRPVASGHVPREFLDAGFELEHGKLVLWPSHARAD
jgi:ATP-dependent Lhr-like helicase